MGFQKKSRLTLRAPSPVCSQVSSFKAEENIIVGNVCLYGATSGEVYFRGMVGPAVRRSSFCFKCAVLVLFRCAVFVGYNTVGLRRAFSRFPKRRQSVLYDEVLLYNNTDTRIGRSKVRLFSHIRSHRTSGHTCR